MNQLAINFTAPARFSGATFDADRDAARLTGQYLEVFALMRDGQWRTLQQIAAATGHPEASVIARLRDFRKERFGRHQVERVFVSRGLFRYRLVVNTGGQ